MRLNLCILALSILPLLAIAEDPTVTVTVTEPFPEATDAPNQSTDLALHNSGFITSTLPSASPARAAATAAATTASSSSPSSDVPVGGAGDGTDSTAGAEGPDKGSASLSSSGIIGLSVFAGVVAVGGIASLVLWFLAKKRGWEVRKSLRRASRRLTGKFESSKSRRQSRREGVRMASPPRPTKHRDLEKGKPMEKPRTATTITSTFDVETPVAKSWKSKLRPWAGDRR